MQTGSLPREPEQPTRPDGPSRSAAPSPLDLFGGRFRVLRAIGRGGMGEVFEAQDLDQGTRVALKTVKLPNEALLQGLRREIRALARLQHPGIVRILGEGVEQGLPWYAMELVEGVPLRRHREKLAGNKSSPLTAQDLPPMLRAFRLLAQALAYLHGEGVVHQDLKPGNVLVRPDGTPVLVDFGLAGLLRGISSREELASAQWAVGGTAPYMAPEQILGAPADPRFDLYALGCLIYELTAGRRFVDETSLQAVLQTHLYSTIPPLDSVMPEAPPALTALVRRLLEKDPRRRLGYATDVVLELENLGARDDRWSAAAQPRSYVYRPGLSGRQAEAERLDRALDRLRQGTGGAILIGGESGVGKTRLLTELGKKAVGKVIQVLIGECRDRGGLPLEALRQPLQTLADRCREQGPAETRRVFGDWGRVLEPYDPALRDLPGSESWPPAPELPPREARLRVFQALREVFETVAAQSPLLLILDDLQWGDGLTLDFLQSTLASADLPFLWVGAYRTEEAAAGHLTPLLQSGAMRHLELAPLTEAEVSPIVSDMLALDRPMPSLDRMLAQHSEGNPFFIAEYLLAAVDEGLLLREPGGQWRLQQLDPSTAPALPTVLRQLLRRRLRGLSHSALQISQTAAVLGRQSQSSLLQSMLELPSDREFLDAVHELVQQRVLEQPDDSPRSLRFVHDKLREVTVADLEPTRKKDLHRLAASALGSVVPPPAAELAYHWEAAGDPAPARRWHLAAARLAVLRHALQEAEHHFLAVLRLAEGLDEDGIRARMELGDEVLNIAARNQEALEHLVQAQAEARQIGDTALLANALRRTASSHHAQGQVHEAQQLYQQALDLFQQMDQRHGEALALRGLASLMQEQGRGSEALPLQQRALLLFGELGERKRQGQILVNLGLIHQEHGQRKEADEAYQQACAILREFGDRMALGRALLNLANLRQETGQFDQAEALYQESLALRREVRDRRGEGMVLVNLANLKSIQAKPLEARPLYLQALILFRQTGLQRGEGFCLMSLGTLYLDLGQAASARASYHRALEVLRQTNDRRGQGLSLQGLARLARFEGDLPQARDLAGQAEVMARQIEDKVLLLQTLCNQGHILLAQGRSAADLLREIQALDRQLDTQPQTDPYREVQSITEAQRRFEAGQHDRLFRGDLLENRIDFQPDPDA